MGPGPGGPVLAASAHDGRRQGRTLCSINVRMPSQYARRGQRGLRRARGATSGMVDVEYQRVGRYTMLRISPWRGDPSTAQVVTVRGPGPDEETIRDLLDGLSHRGVEIGRAHV